jgi:hypothetical protein
LHRSSDPAAGTVTERQPIGEDWLMDVATLTGLLREAEEHHSSYEATAPEHHWSGWYAAYISAREQGSTPEQASNDAALYLERAQTGGMAGA